MVGRWLLGFVAVSTLVVACAEPPPAKKRVAVACDPTVSECANANSGSSKSAKDGALKTTTGAPLEAPDSAKAKEAKAQADEEPSAAPPAGEDDDDAVPLPTPRPEVPVDPPKEPTTGPSCTKLAACCTNLRNAGITGSANQCDTTVKGNDELTCDIQNENYKTPDDFYDPVCF